jgi:hypothetical protein
MPYDFAALWPMRHRIYQDFARTGAPPSLGALSRDLSLTADEARATLRELGRRHAVTLTDAGDAVLMANPFSAVPTPFRVRAGKVSYWANCAWDMLGVPAALGVDATIEAIWAVDGAPAALRVEGGRVTGAEGIVHFLKPFRTWYDDIHDT